MDLMGILIDRDHAGGTGIQSQDQIELRSVLKFESVETSKSSEKKSCLGKNNVLLT
jgi:hypothetical protein